MAALATSPSLKWCWWRRRRKSIRSFPKERASPIGLVFCEGSNPLETKTRWVLFDVPRADYRLRVADDAFDPADAKTALIEVPIRLAAGSDFLPRINPVR